MNARAYCFALAIISSSLACSKEAEGPAAPIQNGSFLVYSFGENVGMTSVQYDVRVDIAQDGGRYLVKFSSTKPGDEAVPPVKVTGGLIPEDNVISAYSFGRLWLPPEGRAPGKRTPCGTVGEKRKYRDWDVWPVEGICGVKQGSRFYEANTGMLVGFIFSGGNEIVSYLKSSG